MTTRERLHRQLAMADYLASRHRDLIRLHEHRLAVCRQEVWLISVAIAARRAWRWLARWERVGAVRVDELENCERKGVIGNV